LTKHGIIEEKTNEGSNMRIQQVEMINMNQLVSEQHPYRTLKKLIDLAKLEKSVELKQGNVGPIGYGMDRLLLCLVLQFMEDLSDRLFERFMAENNAGKWFCGFGITEKTPDYSSFCKFRNKLGCEQIAKIFDEVKRQLTQKGYLAEVFTFVDATALISKLSLWEEKDQSVKDGYEKLNNEILPKYARDKEARIGAKSKTKFWMGFKKHVSVDTQSGMINKVAVTKANVTDAAGAKHVLPERGAVLADKGYIGAIPDILAKKLHPMVILKNNMNDKNPEKDRWISGLRSPYERTFSKQNKRVRYTGVVKNQAAEFLYAIAYNFRRLLVLDAQKTKTLA
jgi:IS5 family transposase